MSMSDLEQKQIVKSWVKEYGYYILFSIVVFLIANYGWRYWQHYKQSKLEQSTFIYTQMLEAQDNKKDDEFKLFGDKLVKDYPKSAYASFAALTIAKNFVNAGDLKSAKEKLQFVVDKSPSDHLKELARIRLARVLIALKEPQKALDLLSGDEVVFISQADEVRGDALLKLGKKQEAERAYRKAQEHNKKEGLKSPLLKMKLQQF